jgi:signal transduction histidine kinase
MTSITASLYGQHAAQRWWINGAALLRAVLRIPLVFKVMGANAIIVAVAVVFVSNGLWGDNQGQLVAVLVALAVACVVNLLLVRLALSPLGELGRVASRVSRGEFGARATASLVADSQLITLTDTINSLLDSLAAERRRIQKLGKEVVSAQDTERAKLARELHDSIAQTLAAVKFQLSAAGDGTTDADLRNSLATARGMLGKVMDEVRNISQSLHPRVTEDLGLVTALEALAQQVGVRGGLKVNVTADIGTRHVPADVAATIFRIAQESLKNAEQHATDGSAEILLYAKDGTLSLEVTDTSHGLDSRGVHADNLGNGLASIRDRVALTGGSMRIDSGENGGLRVTAKLRTSDDA